METSLQIAGSRNEAIEKYCSGLAANLPQLNAVNSVNNTQRYLESSVEQFISVICLEENRISSILFLNFNKHN
jgi:hypothetical protein